MVQARTIWFMVFRWTIWFIRALGLETAKQQAKREQSHPVCLHAVEKYKKLENISTQNDYETTCKK